MGYMEEIPMEEPYRQQLRKEYERPLRNNIIMILIFTTCISVLFFYVLFSRDGEISYYMLFLWVPILFTCRLFFKKLAQHKLHYFKDSKFGFIIKEQVTIIKVFETPAGINIYWLDCDAIKTFTPNPYRNFNQGDQVIIYYLKYSKEYLAYEMPGPSLNLI